MFDKRLTALCPESKKYIAGNIILQWLELALNTINDHHSRKSDSVENGRVS